jgi:hypothetical protein
MGNAVVTPPEAETPALSFPERLIGVFISPGETFEDVARKPGFIAPLVLIILLAIAGTELFLHKIGMEPVVRWALEHNSRVSADQIPAMVEKMTPYYVWIGRVAAIIWPPLVVLVAAVVGLVAVNNIFGRKITFKTAFAVSSYAYAVNIIYYLLAPCMVLFGDPEHYISNPANPTPTSVGFFLNPLNTSKPLLALASSLEIFTFWYMALLAIGFSVASGRKVKTLPLFFCYFGLWVVMVLIKMGLSSIGS